jgi:NAD(P)-dependent dehydrogenase (short-subunit alcohol dehydrogenase family)
MTDRLIIALAQLNPTLGAINANLARARKAREQAQEADLILFPELFICGYPPEDLVLKPAFQAACRAAIEALARTVAAEVGPISLLMNNAGVGGGGKAWSNPAGWDKVLGTNLHGVIHGLQAFVPAMIEGGQRGIVVNTGSKQGITNPPGDTAYNCSKAAVRSLTEGLAHSLREATDGRVTAHLLIPGFTYTGMIAKHVPDRPAGVWSADQVVDVMLAGIEDGAFYLWCLDNETSLETDHRRVLWSAGDIVENRPALSRWHPDHSDAFKAFMARATLD